MKSDTPPEGTPMPYDFKLGLKVAAAAAGAAFFGSTLARIFSSSLRNNETLILAWVLGAILAGVYTWLAARQPDAAKFAPPAIVLVLCVFVPIDLSEGRGNVESMERFWNALPVYLGIIGGSAALTWLVWKPLLMKWAKPKGPPPKALKKKVPSGGTKKKVAPRPEPEELDPDTDEHTAPNEMAPPKPEPPRLQRAVTTELPKLRKPKG